MGNQTKNTDLKIEWDLHELGPKPAHLPAARAEADLRIGAADGYPLAADSAAEAAPPTPTEEEFA